MIGPDTKSLAQGKPAKWGNCFGLKRKNVYNPKGRNQTEEEAKVIDRKILKMLDECGVS